MLCAVLPRFRGRYITRRHLAAAFGSALLPVEDVDHPIRGARYFAVLVPITPNDGCLPQPAVRYFLLLGLIIPSLACNAQYSNVFVPATPNDGCLQQPSALHTPLDVLIIYMILSVLSAVMLRFSTGHSERRNLTATFAFALSAHISNVDHLVRGVLYAVLPRFRTSYSKRRRLTAARILVPVKRYEAYLIQPPRAPLFFIPIISSDACCAQ